MSRKPKSRIITFDHPPSESDLAADLGSHLMGSSSVAFKEDDESFSVGPLPVPHSFIAGVLLVTLVSMALVLWWTNSAMNGWAVFITGCFVSPVLYFLFRWIAEETGTENYLVSHRSTDQIDLPRHSVKYSRTQLREVIFLDRFIFESNYDNGVQFWQVGLLIEEGDGRWTYAHLFNSCGPRSGVRFLGIKNDYARVAEQLEIPLRCITCTREESKSLFDQASRFSQKPSTSFTASPSSVS